MSRSEAQSMVEDSVFQRHTFFTPKYGYKPEGVQIINRLFASALRAGGLPFEYTDGLKYDVANDTFSLICPGAVASELVKSFTRIRDKIIQEECIDDGLGSLTVKPQSKRIFSLDQHVSVRNAFPHSLSSLPCQERWISTVPNGAMESVITREILDGISELTDAELVQDVSRQQVFIASSEGTRILVAVQKLDNVVKFWAERILRESNVFYTEDFTDYQVCFVLFLSVKKKLMETTLLDPAIITDLENDYYLLKRRMTMRCCPREASSGYAAHQALYALKKGEKLRPVIDEDKKSIPSAQWANFFYAGKGDWKEPEDVSISNTQPEPEVIARVEPRIMPDITSWTAGLPEPALKDDFVLPLPMDNPEEFTSAVSSIPLPLSNISFLGRSKNDGLSLEESLNMLRGHIAHPRDNSSEAEGPPLTRPILPGTLSGYLQAQSELRALIQVQKNESFVGSSVAPQNNDSFGVPLPTNLVQAVRALSPTAEVFHPRRENIPLNRVGSVAPVGNSGRSSGAMITSSAIIAPTPFHPRPASVLTSTQNHVHSVQGSPAAAVQSQSNLVVDFKDLGIGQDTLSELFGLYFPSMVELMPGEDLDAFFGGENPAASLAQNLTSPQVQQQDEPSSRKFHSTMKQQAPANKGKGLPPKLTLKGKAKLNPPPQVPAQRFVEPLPSLPNPSLQFLASIQDGVLPLLSQMKNWNGKLILKAELGRFIIKRLVGKELIYEESRRNSQHAVHAVDAITMNQIDFTKLVTTLPAEAQYVLEMKDTKGQTMWNSKPKIWQVSYVFSCLDIKYGIRFEVVMDGESHDYKIHLQPYVFGVVNVHATLRNWDYRIVAQGFDLSGKKYDVLVEEFVKSISIPGNRQTLEMTFEIAIKHEVEVESIRIRRECGYVCANEPYKQSILHIDEVEDMCVLSTTARVEGKTNYWIKSHDEKTSGLKTFTRKWIEFSVTDKSADEAFKENSTVELGESAEWEPENLITKGLILSLCNPMSQIVMNGDGLGFWNEEVRPDADKEAVEGLHASVTGTAVTRVL